MRQAWLLAWKSWWPPPACCPWPARRGAISRCERTEGEWCLRAGLLKNRLVSYGLSVVRFVHLPGLGGSKLGRLLTEFGHKADSTANGQPLGATPRNLHLTLLPVLRSQFALPEDKEQAEACRAELLDLRSKLPEGDHFSRYLARLEAATAADPPHLQAQLNRQWESALAFFRRPGLPLPRPGDRALPLESCQLKLTPNGYLILVLPDLLADREWAGQVAEASDGWLTDLDESLHLTLLQVASQQAFDRLRSRLTEPVAAGGTIWLGHGELVSYKDRGLSTLVHRETISWSWDDGKAV